MPKHLTPFEQTLFATVRIEAEDGTNDWVGTGFFYMFDVGEGQEVILLVSNRHVLEQAKTLTFWCHLKDSDEGPSGEKFDFKVALSPGDVVAHPDNETDLAAVAIGPCLNHLLRIGKAPFLKALGIATIPTNADWESFDAVQDILMLGCPLGLFDEHNKFAIFRRGISASHLNYDYKGRKQFLVDIAAFEGSSGSPIFVNMERKYNREKGKYEQSHLATDVKLAGILSSGPEYSHEGEVSLSRASRVSFKLPMHLGIAIKSTEIASLVEAFRAAKQV